MNGINSARARFDNLDLEVRTQWVAKGKQSALNYLHFNKQVISIKLARTVGLSFYVIFDFENVNMA